MIGIKNRKPFVLFLDILDFKLVAVDGKKPYGAPYYIRFDSKGRVFRKSKVETGGFWERMPKAEVDMWFRGRK